MEQGIIEPKVLKGFRDFSPSEMHARNTLLQKLIPIVSSYGFDQLETPTIEYEEILTGSIGEDEKLMYRFTDDGGRKVALRYDQTVGACRFLAMNYHELPMPFKRYQISNVFRAENTQKGRYREFLQFDADIFGVESIGADIEMILLTCDIYKALGFVDFEVHISDRALLQGVPYPVLAVIDKLDKIGLNGVIAGIKERGFSDAEALVDRVLHAQKNERIQAILDAAKHSGFSKNVVFDPSIMRSFSYSTGTIWEVRIPTIISSVLGGERFDNLVSRFSKEKIPGIGFGLGFDRTLEAMEQFGLISQMKTNTKLLITVFSEAYLPIYARFARDAREKGIATELYPIYTDKIGKQIKYADKKGIKYVIIMGEDEKEKGIVSLKNLESGEQISSTFEEVCIYISQKEHEA